MTEWEKDIQEVEKRQLEGEKSEIINSMEGDKALKKKKKSWRCNEKYVNQFKGMEWVCESERERERGG